MKFNSGALRVEIFQIPSRFALVTHVTTFNYLIKSGIAAAQTRPCFFSNVIGVNAWADSLPEDYRRRLSFFLFLQNSQPESICWKLSMSRLFIKLSISVLSIRLVSIPRIGPNSRNRHIITVLWNSVLMICDSFNHEVFCLVIEIFLLPIYELTHYK